MKRALNLLLNPILIFQQLELLSYFLKELILANISVAVAIFKPNKKLKPAIVKIPLELKSDLGITLFANMITLTPGTLTLEIDKKRKFIFVHVLNSDNFDSTINEIKNGFELRLKKIYG